MGMCFPPPTCSEREAPFPYRAYSSSSYYYIVGRRFPITIGKFPSAIGNPHAVKDLQITTIGKYPHFALSRKNTLPDAFPIGK